MKKILSLILAVGLLACLFAGCGSDKKYADDATGSPASDPAASSKTLVMATNVAFPPYEFYENEQPAGIDVEIATAICEKLGYKLDIMDIEFGAILGAVSSGKADFTMAGLTVTEERKQSRRLLRATQPASSPSSSRKTPRSPRSTISTPTARDYQIGVQQDTTGDIYCTDDFGDDHVQRYNKGADAVRRSSPESSTASSSTTSPQSPLSPPTKA